MYLNYILYISLYYINHYYLYLYILYLCEVNVLHFSYMYMRYTTYLQMMIKHAMLPIINSQNLFLQNAVS